MNVTLPENTMDRKHKILYLVIILISIAIFIFSLFYVENKEITVGNLKKKTEQSYEKLKENFDKLFTNELKNYNDNYKNRKEKSNEALIYTKYEKEANIENAYDINVKIPYINIKDDTIKNYNEEIEDIFKKKAEDIMATKNKNSIYTVEYSSYIEDGILSIAIKANLKEGNNTPRVIVKTYNYDLESNKEVDLKTLLDRKNVELDYVQNKINTEVREEQKRTDDLKDLGYKIFERDLDSKIYKVENIKDFYYENGSIYVIFAYGNEKYTSELDVIVI